MPKKLTPLQKEIARRNREWAKAKNKKVLLAKDIITQIKGGRFSPVSGIYVEGFDIMGDEETSLRDIMLETDIQCKCCAKGALMLSATLFNNNYKLGEFHRFLDHTQSSDDPRTAEEIQNGLSDVFTPKEIHDLEQCFEGWRGRYYYTRKYRNPALRLVAMMENIIENGEFVVPNDKEWG
jgi:hypothetical protein